MDRVHAVTARLATLFLQAGLNAYLTDIREWRKERNSAPSLTQVALHAHELANTRAVNVLQNGRVDEDTQDLLRNDRLARLREDLDGPDVQHPPDTNPRVDAVGSLHDLGMRHEQPFGGLLSPRPCRLRPAADDLVQLAATDVEPIRVTERGRRRPQIGLRDQELENRSGHHRGTFAWSASKSRMSPAENVSWSIVDNGVQVGSFPRG